MRKLRLKVEALEVETFTAGSVGARGTALAHGLSEGDEYDSGCGACTRAQTCPGTCRQTCQQTCDTSLYPFCPC